MHLSPREIDKLLLHNAGFLAQKRLARGVRLNHPEAVALIATQLLEFIRDGRSVAELMNLGRQFLGRNQVMSGVPSGRDAETPKRPPVVVALFGNVPPIKRSPLGAWSREKAEEMLPLT